MFDTWHLYEQTDYEADEQDIILEPASCYCSKPMEQLCNCSEEARTQMRELDYALKHRQVNPEEEAKGERPLSEMLYLMKANKPFSDYVVNWKG